jgi:hypothetical protein
MGGLGDETRFKGKPNFDLSQPCPMCGYKIQPTMIVPARRAAEYRLSGRAVFFVRLGRPTLKFG